MINRSRYDRGVAALAAFSLAMLLRTLAIQHHQRWLLIVATSIGALFLLLLMRFNRWLWYTLIIACVAGASQSSWRRGELLWAILYAVTVAFGLVQIFRAAQFSRQFAGARDWPLAKGGFSGSYVDGENRVIYYGYKVNDSHYSRSVVAGSSLKKGLKARLDALKGKPVFVRYKPDKPEISTLFSSDQTESLG